MDETESAVTTSAMRPYNEIVAFFFGGNLMVVIKCAECDESLTPDKGAHPARNVAVATKLSSAADQAIASEQAEAARNWPICII